MKFRRLTPALALVALCTAGVASAQSTAPTTPSTTPNDSTATPPNNAKVPPGTQSPAPHTGATPRANTHMGTKNGSGTHHNNGSMSKNKGTNGKGAMSNPSDSVPATGAGK